MICTKGLLEIKWAPNITRNNGHKSNNAFQIEKLIIFKLFKRKNKPRNTKNTPKNKLFFFTNLTSL